MREKIEEAFKDTKNRLDGTRTRVWDGDTLKGRMFCQFVGLGYQCFLHTKIKELKEKLELSLSDKKLAEKDKDQNADLLKWLKKQSMQSLIDWFDCIELMSLRSDDGTVTQRSSDTKRDRLSKTRSLITTITLRSADRELISASQSAASAVLKNTSA